jgi:prepilin-type N-terminal cleavage/methylation domain-containing protein
VGDVAAAEIMNRRSNNSRGFTLVEVLVAITLMSLVMVTLVLGMRLTANAWHRGEQKLDEDAQVMAGTDVLTQQISAAAVRVVTEVGANNAPVQVVAFYGSPAELRFCTRNSWRGENSRPQYMADYRVAKDAQGKQQLVISEVGLTDDASVVAALQAPAPASGEAVGSVADRIELAYFQPASAVQPAQWVSTWTPQDGAELPRAVQVRWTRGSETQSATFAVAINHNIPGSK